MNISFVKPGEEECERCDFHDKHLEDIHKLDKHELSKPDENGKKNRKPTFVDCAVCVDFELYIKTATKAREKYREEKNREWTDNEKVVSVDMQKIIMLPRLPGLKVVVFCKRIVVFNETFAPVGGSKNGKDKATDVLWHEGIRGRSTADVESKFVSFIRKCRDTKDFIFLLDNCSAQNKNWYLYTALLNEVNAEGEYASSVTLKYFEPAHTFMSTDDFHHQMEQRMRQKKNVEYFQDFVDVVSSCDQSLVMKCNDFLDFQKGVSQANYTREKPKLEQVQVIKFEREGTKIFWKKSHKSESFTSFKLLQKKYERNIGKDFNRVLSPRGVKPDKKENITKGLYPHMKERIRSFWHNVEGNDASVDLIDEREEYEDC